MVGVEDAPVWGGSGSCCSGTCKNERSESEQMGSSGGEGQRICDGEVKKPNSS